MSYSRPCEACGDPKTTRHHVYPRYLREFWRHKVKQKIAFLCRLCHDVVHTPYTTRDLVLLLKQDPGNTKWFEYHRRFRSPQIQTCLGAYRRIIRVLLRDGVALHLEETTYYDYTGPVDLGPE